MERNGDEYRNELKRRLKILKDHLEDGKMKIAPHLFEDTKKSLMAVRFDADGQIDLSTVDARVRSIAMAVTAMQDRDILHIVGRGSFPIAIPSMATSAPTMASADFCRITLHVAMQNAVERPHVEQISPDKNVNFHYTGK